MLKALPFALALCLAIAPVAAAGEHAGQEPPPAETLAGSAKTPEQHRAVAAYYEERASAARRDANVHHQMELSYSHWITAQEMVKHCRELVASDKRIAREYDALARAHIAAAEK